MRKEREREWKKRKNISIVKEKKTVSLNRQIERLVSFQSAISYRQGRAFMMETVSTRLFNFYSKETDGQKADQI